MMGVLCVDQLPSALDQFSEIRNKIERCELILFLDYDGTLTPIVPHPEAAILSQSMRSILHELASYFYIAIISGRDLKDLQSRVGIKNLIYSGSHGFEIVGPNEMNKELPEARILVPLFDEIEKELKREIQPFKGVQLERKHFSIAIHYRNVKEDEKQRIKEQIESFSQSYDQLKLTHGKEVLELRPNLEWDKGKALLWLLEQLSRNTQPIFPIYIGDDLTDEDAFQAIQNKGLGIVVGVEHRETLAKYALKNTQEVELFLKKLLRRGF